MSRGDKSSYTDKQKREAAHIEAGYEDRGKPAAEAERIAWATVNKESGGGKKSGSGRAPAAHPEASLERARQGGKLGGQASAARSAAAKSASAKRGAQTRKRNAAAAAGTQR